MHVSPKTASKPGGPFVPLSNKSAQRELIPLPFRVLISKLYIPSPSGPGCLLSDVFST